MSKYEKEFLVNNEEKLCEVKCPNKDCKNKFLITPTAIEISRKFECKKCGSVWYATRKEIK